MTNKKITFNKIKKAVNYFLIALTIALTVAFFWGNSDNLFYRFVLSLVGLAFEAVRVLALVDMKTQLRIGFHKKTTFKIIGNFMVFIGLTVFSIIASTSFITSQMVQQDVNIQVENAVSFTEQSLLDQLTEVKAQIESAQKQQSNLEEVTGWATASDKYNEQIANLQKTRDEISAKLDAMNKEDNQSSEKRVSTKDQFDTLINFMSSGLKRFLATLSEKETLEGSDLFFLIMFGIVLFLEIILFFTTSAIDEMQKGKFLLNGIGYDNFVIFVKALFDIKEGTNRLNGINRIMDKTGFSKSQCEEYLNVLKKFTYKGQHLITQNGKAYMANKVNDARVLRVIELHRNINMED